MAKNVFVLGLTDLQRKELETLQYADWCEFHDLIGYDRLVAADELRFADLLEQGRRELDAFDGSVDAVVAHWDFPTSVLAPILAAEHGIPAPSLRSVVTCEHKYWSRLEQRASVPDHVPDFAAFDPFADDVLEQIGLPFPFWVKPIKSFSSQLGFRIDDEDDLARAVAALREGVHEVGDAFDEVLAMLDLPPEVADVAGTDCLAEGIITGRQTAPEGSVARGRFSVHGVFDMHLDERGESIVALDYPASRIPERVQDQMADVSERFLRHVGFDDGCFNVEFLWDEPTDSLKIIEVNTRISQSHSDLFAKVDRVSNHQIAVDVALGAEPSLPDGAGTYAVAAKCIILEREDGVVTRVPSEDELAELQRRFPETVFQIDVEPGDRLADLAHQDTYNYGLGDVYVGADSREDLERRRQEILSSLRFELDRDVA
ncbi:MAG: acetyl-CoA carboxylase biotin carboxylase subunit family protein [Acidimicrobiia bacterium]